ncbi:MAG: hypothetical protein ACRCUE_08965 [Bosea sp. (in: a-proteobacteria)]
MSNRTSSVQISHPKGDNDWLFNQFKQAREKLAERHQTRRGPINISDQELNGSEIPVVVGQAVKKSA